MLLPQSLLKGPCLETNVPSRCHKACSRGCALRLLFVITLLVSAVAYADDSPQFGGCLAGGDVCLGPSAAVTVGEFNLTTSKFAGGVIPGVGYGATYRPNEWYATGAALYLSFLVGQGQPNQAIPTLMFSFANYVRLGVGVSVTEQTSGPAQTQWKLYFGFGSEIGGSPKYVRSQLSHVAKPAQGAVP